MLPPFRSIILDMYMSRDINIRLPSSRSTSLVGTLEKVEEKLPLTIISQVEMTKRATKCSGIES